VCSDIEGYRQVATTEGSTLCKPSDAKALEDAIAQYRLINAEKELLNKTLSGSIKLLTEILSTIDFKSFSRSDRLRSTISEVMPKIQIENSWEVHLAAMLAPIGYVALPPETIVKAREGQVLSKVEEQLMASVPDVAARLLSNIPRLEGIAKIVKYQHKHFDGLGSPMDGTSGEAIPAGARLLKILSDMVQLQSTGMLPLKALSEMQQRQGWYDPKLLGAVRTCFGGRETDVETGRATVSLTPRELRVGMVLRSDVKTRDGTLVLAAGHEISDMSLEKIQNFEQVSGIQEPILVEAKK
jgi:response regulator RpfG family c-di-GMP phosphodiesterase